MQNLAMDKTPMKLRATRKSISKFWSEVTRCKKIEKFKGYIEKSCNLEEVLSQEIKSIKVEEVPDQPPIKCQRLSD